MRIIFYLNSLNVFSKLSLSLYLMDISLIADMMSGDLVSVVVDLDGQVLKGDTQPLSGPRLHVGNGVAQFDRDAIFKSQPPPRYCCNKALKFN